MGNKESKTRSTRATITPNLLDEFRGGDRGKRIREINRNIDRFDTFKLRKEIVEYMENSSTKAHTSSIVYLKLHKFKQIFIDLLQYLSTQLYGEILSSIAWCIESHKLDFDSESIRLNLLQIYLRSGVCESAQEDKSNHITIFREFVDCWVSAESIEILNYILFFAVQQDDCGDMDTDKIYTKRDKSMLRKETRGAIDKVLGNRDVFSIQYIKNVKFSLDTNQSHTQAEKLEFFLNQMIEESRTITLFLFSLFHYMFDFIGLKDNRAEVQMQKDVITRYLFSKDSTLLALSLYLTGVLHSSDHKKFVKKRAYLQRHDDKQLFETSYLKSIDKTRSGKFQINFPSDLSKVNRMLCTKLVKELEAEYPTSFEDIIKALKLFARFLDRLSQQDHFLLYYWLCIFDCWMIAVFGLTDLDCKISLLHITVKYLASDEVLIFAMVLLKLHKKLEEEQTLPLFIEILKRDFKVK